MRLMAATIEAVAAAITAAGDLAGRGPGEVAAQIVRLHRRPPGLPQHAAQPTSPERTELVSRLLSAHAPGMPAVRHPA